MKSALAIHKKKFAMMLFIASFSAFTSCGSKRSPSIRTASTPKTPPIGWKEQGNASWYGEPYHGRRAANGEIYDMNAFTAAHKSLPFETWVRVKNLSNDKSTEVRITDRGPFVKGRIIDLSRAAAREIDLVGPGVSRVKLEVIRPPKTRSMKSLETSRIAIQIAALTDETAAHSIATQAAKFGETKVSLKPGSSPPLYRIIVFAQSLESVRSDYHDAFIVNLP